jgi:hypothetical protein
MMMKEEKEMLSSRLAIEAVNYYAIFHYEGCITRVKSLCSLKTISKGDWRNRRERMSWKTREDSRIKGKTLDGNHHHNKGLKERLKTWVLSFILLSFLQSVWGSNERMKEDEKEEAITLWTFLSSLSRPHSLSDFSDRRSETTTWDIIFRY